MHSTEINNIFKMKIKKELLSEQEIVKTDKIKSEEVQAIIDRMPTYWVKWVVFCISILVAVLITLSFIIQYPDTVDGEITITAHLAPVRLVSKSNAMVH